MASAWKHIVAIVIVIGCLTLRGFGIDGVTEYMLYAVAATYFADSALKKIPSVSVSKPHG